MNSVKNYKRGKHLEGKISCMGKEISKCLKKTGMGYFQRRRFITALKQKMRVFMIQDWYPDNPSIGAADRTMTLKPMHWTISQAGTSAKIRRDKLEHHFYGVESITVHPTMGVIKHWNLPSKVIYDDEQLLNTFDPRRMEKKDTSRGTWPNMKGKKNYIGTLGNNPTDDERALTVSTALAKLHQNNLELCNVCKHINVDKVMEKLKEETTRRIEISRIEKEIIPPPKEMYMIPIRKVEENVNLDEKYCGYETIFDNMELDEEKLQGGQKYRKYNESTPI